MSQSYGDGTERKSKKKYILVAVLLLLVVVVLAAAIHFYPVWSCAEVVSREADFSSFAYELELELDREKLSWEQQKLIEEMEKLTGCETDAMYQLRLRGSVWEDRIYVLLFLKGEQTPLMELYLSDEEIMVNETVLYNRIRENLVEKYGLLARLLPEQTDVIYMTLEQVEQMLGVDIRGAFSFERQEAPTWKTWQYFIMLASLRCEKMEDGRIFSLNDEQLQVQISVPDKEEAFPLRAVFSIQDPDVLADKLDLSKISWLFPDENMEVEIPEELKILKSGKIALAWGDREEIDMPGELVSQDVVDLVSVIREWIQKLTQGGE